MHIGQSTTQPSSLKLLAVDGINRDPQLGSVQRVRDFGAPSAKWDAFTKLLPQGSVIYVEEL